MTSDFSAVLLAAGRSTRMGRDKALLEVDGRPLWQRQREVLQGLGAAELFLSVRPEQEWARHAGFSKSTTRFRSQRLTTDQLSGYATRHDSSRQRTP